MFAKTAVFLVAFVVFVDAAPLVSLRPILESVTTPDLRPLVPVTVPNVRYKLETVASKRDDVRVEVGADIRNEIGFNFGSGINLRFPLHKRDYGSREMGSGPSGDQGMGSDPSTQDMGSGPSSNQDMGSDPNTQGMGPGPSGDQDMGSDPNTQGMGPGPSGDQDMGPGPSDTQDMGPDPSGQGMGPGPSGDQDMGPGPSDTQDMGPDPSGQDMGPDPSDTQDDEPFDQFADYLTMGKRGTVDLNTLGSQIIDGLKSHGLLEYVDHFSVRIQRLKDLLAGDVSSVQITAEANNLLLEYRQVLAGLRVDKPVVARDIVIDSRVLLRLQSLVVNTVNLLNALGKSDAVDTFLSEVNNLKAEARNGTLDVSDLLDAACEIIRSAL